VDPQPEQDVYPPDDDDQQQQPENDDYGHDMGGDDNYDY
jgi:hypothetical protein